MTILKRFAFVFTAVVFMLLLLASTAGAVTVDGKLEYVEWKGTTVNVLVKAGTSSNCSIYYAMMKIIVDNSKQAVYLGFQATQKQSDVLETNNTQAGIKLNLEGNEYIVCTSSGISNFNINKYDVAAKVIIGANNDFNAEIRIGFKDGIPEKAVQGIQIIDGFGQPSNVYGYPIESTTVTTVKETATVKETTAKAETTAKQTTAKAGTTANTATTAKATTAKEAVTTALTQVRATTQTATVNSTAVQNTVSTTHKQVFASTESASKTNNTSAGYSGGLQAYTAPEPGNEYADGLTQTGELLTQTTAVPDVSGGSQEVTENDKESIGFNKSKQIIATTVAVLLLVAAACLSVFAGRTKVTNKPSKKEDQDEPDDDF